METNIGKPVVLEKPDKGIELKTYRFPKGRTSGEYYEGWVNDKRYLVPDSKLESMKNLINATLIRSDDPKSIRRDFNKTKEYREEQYKAKLRKLSAKVNDLEKSGYIEKRESQKPLKSKFKWKKTKLKRNVEKRKSIKPESHSVADSKKEVLKDPKKLSITKTDTPAKPNKDKGVLRDTGTQKLSETRIYRNEKANNYKEKLKYTKKKTNTSIESSAKLNYNNKVPKKRKTRIIKFSDDSKSSETPGFLCCCCIWSWIKHCAYHIWNKMCHSFNKRSDR